MTQEEKDIYLKFGLAGSMVLFGFDGEDLKVLIHQKKDEPFKGAYLLPGRYIKTDEAIDPVIKELMHHHTGAEYAYMEQLKAFPKVFRNPEGRIINISYYALVKIDEEMLQKTEKRKGIWVNYDEIPDLAYDHNEIVEYAKERLKRRVKRRPIGFFLLPKLFTIGELQKLYEKSLNKELDKRNFRKKIFKSELIIPTEHTKPGPRKDSVLYKFDEDKYEKLTLKGYDFLF
ncbi:MAG: NUDIX hydrolase [Flavobacteriales bacterium]|nr:NUDIX hydrolase [Flavobacteriales bacterium]